MVALVVPRRTCPWKTLVPPGGEKEEKKKREKKKKGRASGNREAP